jgi:hypothetical protein
MMRFKDFYRLNSKPTANSTPTPEKTTRRQELIARIQKLKAAKRRLRS